MGLLLATSVVCPAQVTFTEYPIPTPSALELITTGPDGNLWFTDARANQIGRITTTGVITEFTIPTFNSGPVGITTGPDGNLWFAETTGNQIGRITITGVITEFALPTGDSSPWGITKGPDGNLWFTEQGGNRIGRITITGVITEFALSSQGGIPNAITTGPDGNLWFTQGNASNIARITPTGVITEFALPTRDSYPTGITTGPDGNLWFNEQFANKIGKANLSECGRKTMSIPASQTRADAGWGLSYQVTPLHGLEVDNVFLATRYMAASMNLPYFYLQTSKFPLTRCVLTADGSPQVGCSATSRLVDFKTSQPNVNPLEIEATYEVDNISSNPNACVLITQDYQFSAPVYPALNPTTPGCEPSDTLPCARFKPMVSYKFISNDKTETLTSINTAQRLQFAVDLRNPGLLPSWAQSTLLAKDCNLSRSFIYAGECFSPPFIETLNAENPLGREVSIPAISNGGPGLFDNFHQTFKGQIQEPKFAFNWPPVSPGCLECVHIHWRWADAASNFGNFGRGLPLLQNSGSNQSVDVAAVRYRTGEEDPATFDSLVNGESLIGQPIVFWYSATGFQPSDTFFAHGGFFNPTSSAQITLAASIVSQAKSGTTLTVNVRIINTSSGNAKNVYLNSISVQRLAGTGNITLSGPSLPLSKGDLLPGGSVVVPLTLNVPTTATKLSLNERWTAADDQGNVYTVSLGQVVFP